MGYNTTFSGGFTFNKPVTEKLKKNNKWFFRNTS